MILRIPCIQDVRDTVLQFVRLFASLFLSLSLFLCVLSFSYHLTADIPERRRRANAKRKEKKSESSRVRAMERARSWVNGEDGEWRTALLT